jgi:hypothetical protein
MNIPPDIIGVLFFAGVAIIVYLAVLLSSRKKKNRVPKIKLDESNSTSVNIDAFISKYRDFLSKDLHDRLIKLRSLYPEAFIRNEVFLDIKAQYDKECEIQNNNVRDFFHEAPAKIEELVISLDRGDDPIVLREIKFRIEALLDECIELKQANPHSIYSLKGSTDALKKVKERYNKRLCSIIKHSVEQYKLQISEQATNQDIDKETVNLFEKINQIRLLLDRKSIDCFNCLIVLEDYHNDIEALYSSLMHKDIELSKAFAIITKNKTYKGYLLDIVELICSGKIDSDRAISRKDLNNILEKYFVNIADIKFDLLDLLLSYIDFISNSHLFTTKESNNIKLLKNLFKIKEGDFYKYRFNEIKSLCQKHFVRLSRNCMDKSDKLFWSELQDAFGLSTIQLEKFKVPETTYEEDADEIEDGDAHIDLNKRDSLFDEAARLVVRYQQGSTSLIQRRLNLGYNRAARIMEQLEAEGIVGPQEGINARQVMITNETLLDRVSIDYNNDIN